MKRFFALCLFATFGFALVPVEAASRDASLLKARVWEILGDDEGPDILSVAFDADAAGREVFAWCEDGESPQVYYAECFAGLCSRPVHLSDPDVSSTNPSVHFLDGSSMDELVDETPDESSDQDDPDPSMDRFSTVVVLFESTYFAGTTRINFYIRPDPDPWDDEDMAPLLLRGNGVSTQASGRVYHELHVLDSHIWLTWVEKENSAVGYSLFLKEVWTKPKYHHYSKQRDIPLIMEKILKIASK